MMKEMQYLPPENSKPNREETPTHYEVLSLVPSASGCGGGSFCPCRGHGGFPGERWRIRNFPNGEGAGGLFTFSKGCEQSATSRLCAVR